VQDAWLLDVPGREEHELGLLQGRRQRFGLAGGRLGHGDVGGGRGRLLGPGAAPRGDRRERRGGPRAALPGRRELPLEVGDLALEERDPVLRGFADALQECVGERVGGGGGASPRLVPHRDHDDVHHRRGRLDRRRRRLDRRLAAQRRRCHAVAGGPRGVVQQRLAGEQLDRRLGVRVEAGHGVAVGIGGLADVDGRRRVVGRRLEERQDDAGDDAHGHEDEDDPPVARDRAEVRGDVDVVTRRLFSGHVAHPTPAGCPAAAARGTRGNNVRR